MKGQTGFKDKRKRPRFNFVSAVKYVILPDITGERFKGLASDVSINGLSLSVDRPLEVGQEILIEECVLPYVRAAYKVQRTNVTDENCEVGLIRKTAAPKSRKRRK
jgi:PilZ domain